MIDPQRKGRVAGFTLIELLIVVAIIGVLVAAFLPDLLGGKQQASEVATTANMQRLALGCQTFERKHHYFPPDDLVDPEGKLQWKADNGINTGIESLVAFLSQSVADGADLGDMAGRLTNTDNDEHGAALPTLGRKDRVEVADEWGTPFAYFSQTSKNGGFDKSQTVTFGGETPPMTVKALRNADGQPVGMRKFQLLSAGKDQTFGTDDDLSYPEKPGK